MSDLRIEKMHPPVGDRVPLIVAFGLKISHPGRELEEHGPAYDFATQRTTRAAREKSTSRDEESRGITLINSRPDTRRDD
jgi:hypothetical protein